MVPPAPATGPAPNAPVFSGIAPCGPPGDFWIAGEYLLWWLRPGHVPPLVTTSSPASAGVLTRPDTVILFGNGQTNDQARSGGRVTGGVWFDTEHTLGIQASVLYLEQHGKGFAGTGDGGTNSPILALPFFNALAGRPDAQLIAQPNGTVGGIIANASRRFQGAELNGLYNLLCGAGYRLDLLAGARYLELDERLNIDSTTINNSVLTQVGDFFIANTRFYGGQVGVKGEVWSSSFFADFVGKIALGNSQQTVGIDGVTRLFTGAQGLVVETPGGLISPLNNLGGNKRDHLAFAPEVGLRAGYQATEHFRVFVGYSFLYLSSVARAGDQIDLVVNPLRQPLGGSLVTTGPARPAFVFQSTDFWAQGVSAGLEFRY